MDPPWIGTSANNIRLELLRVSLKDGALPTISNAIEGGSSQGKRVNLDDSTNKENMGSTVLHMIMEQRGSTRVHVVFELMVFLMNSSSPSQVAGF